LCGLRRFGGSRTGRLEERAPDLGQSLPEIRSRNTRRGVVDELQETPLAVGSVALLQLEHEDHHISAGVVWIPREKSRGGDARQKRRAAVPIDSNRDLADRVDELEAEIVRNHVVRSTLGRA